MDSQADDTDDKEKPGFLKKIVAIPCMRNSLLNGISSGLGIGLTYFLFTSNVTKATNWGTGGFLLVMYGTWGVCRYQRAKEQQMTQLWQKTQQENAGKIKLVDPKDV